MGFSPSGLEFDGTFLCKTLNHFFVVLSDPKTQTLYHHHHSPLSPLNLRSLTQKLMERNSFSNSFLKDNEAAIKDNNNKYNYKLNADSSSSWSCNNQGFGDDYLAGFSWPPRSYTCSFCKREFRSAQALGGHMNVHRRDRARLRQSPPEDLHLLGAHGQSPFLNLNLNPNPNPNLSSSSSTPSAFHSPFSTPKWRVNGTLIDPLMTSKAASDSTNMMNLGSAKSVFGVKELKDYDRFMGKKTDYVTLDLEIGLVSDHSKEDLDLELRLGYS